MSRLVLISMLCLSALAAGAAQTPTQFVGKLEPDLVPGPIKAPVAMTPVSDEARKSLGALVAGGDRVLAGNLLFVGDGKRPIYLIVSSGAATVVTDLNGNGLYEANERVALTPTTEAGIEVAATLAFTTPGAPFARYPVRVGLHPGQLASLASGQPLTSGPFDLWMSMQAFAAGVVPIDGKPTKVQLIVNPRNFTVDPAKNYQYVDANGDGEFDTDVTSWETGVGRGAPVVFHIGDGDRYVSIAAVDPVAHTITLTARTAADYPRIELRLGSTVPEFSFTALDGSTHHLSDYRGNYVLLDFWGTWCGPCIGDIPYLKKAYETYKDKGFEILGMDNEIAMQDDVTADDLAKGLEKVQAFVIEKGMTWPQARTESIKSLFEKRFQIIAWPTMILLDPQDRILSVNPTSKGWPGLMHEKLDQTLAGIFKGVKTWPAGGRAN